MPSPLQPHPPIDLASQSGSTGGHSFRLIEARKYTLKEAGKKAGVSEATMRNEVKFGEIPVIRIGTKMMIIEQDLEQYLQRHYQYEGNRESPSVGCPSLPDWVENSPLLKPKRNAS
jgi:excisionase family DNA binding protein